MRTTRLLALGLAAALGACGLIVACGSPPPATPTTASTTKNLVVCWRVGGDDAGEEAFAVALRNTIGERLRSAGYKLAPNRCDLHIKWNTTWKTRGGDTSYTTATLILRNRKEETLDVIRYEIDRDHVPVTEPDRLAILFVNSINSSPKIEAYAARLADRRGGRADGGDTETTSAPISDASAN